MTIRYPVDNILAKLITVLSEEIRMYNELLLVLRRKQSSIIEGKLEQLKETVASEQTILKKTEQLALSREASFREASNLLGQDQEIRSLSQLIGVVESTYAGRLKDIHHSLKRILKEVTLVNEENRYLLEYSIKFVREAVRELIKSSEQFPVYSAQGAGREGPGRTNIIEGTI